MRRVEMNLAGYRARKLRRHEGTPADRVADGGAGGVGETLALVEALLGGQHCRVT